MMNNYFLKTLIAFSCMLSTSVAGQGEDSTIGKTLNRLGELGLNVSMETVQIKAPSTPFKFFPENPLESLNGLAKAYELNIISLKNGNKVLVSPSLQTDVRNPFSKKSGSIKFENVTLDAALRATASKLGFKLAIFDDASVVIPAIKIEDGTLRENIDLMIQMSGGKSWRARMDAESDQSKQHTVFLQIVR